MNDFYHHTVSAYHDYLLVDGAQFPEQIYPLLCELPDTDWCEVYDEVQAEVAGAAGLFLAVIRDKNAAWTNVLLSLDQQAPCLIHLVSRLPLNDLAMHLQAFLQADIGDGMSALIRYFDPRNLPAVVAIWDEATRQRFIGPLKSLYYRGHFEQWQHLDGTDQVPPETIDQPITLNQTQQDQLLLHCEADQILTMLIENDLLQGGEIYWRDYQAVLPHYRRAREWGFEQAEDIYQFCACVCCYHPRFDDHPAVNAVLRAGCEQKHSFAQIQQQIADYVWQECLVARQKKPE